VVADIDAAVAVGNGCIESRHGGVVGDVDREGGRLAGQVGGGPLGGREVDVGDGDQSALLGQAAAGGEADAGGTAGDDADLSLDASGHGGIKRERGARVSRTPLRRLSGYSPSCTIRPIVSYLARSLDFRYSAYPIPPTNTSTSITTRYQA